MYNCADVTIKLTIYPDIHKELHIAFIIIAAKCIQWSIISNENVAYPSQWWMCDCEHNISIKLYNVYPNMRSYQISCLISAVNYMYKNNNTAFTDKNRAFFEEYTAVFRTQIHIEWNCTDNCFFWGKGIL